MKKKTYALVAAILNGMEMGILVLLALASFALKDSSSFETELNNVLNQQGLDLASLGITYNEVMMSVILIFSVIAVYSIIKFILNLIGYLKSNSTMILIAAILSIVDTVVSLFFVGIIFAVPEGLIAVLLFMAYNSIKSDERVQRQFVNNENNKNNEEKTVIDIEL